MSRCFKNCHKNVREYITLNNSYEEKHYVNHRDHDSKGYEDCEDKYIICERYKNEKEKRKKRKCKDKKEDHDISRMDSGILLFSNESTVQIYENNRQNIRFYYEGKVKQLTYEVDIDNVIENKITTSINACYSKTNSLTGTGYASSMNSNRVFDSATKYYFATSQNYNNTRLGEYDFNYTSSSRGVLKNVIYNIVVEVSNGEKYWYEINCYVGEDNLFWRIVENIYI